MMNEAAAILSIVLGIVILAFYKHLSDTHNEKKEQAEFWSGYQETAKFPLNQHTAQQFYDNAKQYPNSAYYAGVRKACLERGAVER